MRAEIFDILKGRFLIDKDAIKNWRFIIYAAFLAFVMIVSSHRIDQKVHYIARLNDNVRELRSEFVDTRSTLQKLKLESTLVKRVAPLGLKSSQVPPKKIKVVLEQD